MCNSYKIISHLQRSVFPFSVDPNLPKELMDFKPTIQGKIEPREIVVEGRTIKPREIQHGKPNNSSVR